MSRGAGGQALVELAVALPVFVLVVAVALDGALLVHQYSQAGHAAAASARALADAVLAEGHALTEGLPEWVQDLAAEEVRRRLAPLAVHGVEVEADWAGPPLVTERAGGDYTFAVRVPDAPNTVTVADPGNDHRLSYQQPRVGQDTVQDWHTAQTLYQDRTGTTSAYTYEFPHAHAFQDWTPPDLHWYNTFQVAGPWVGAWYWVSSDTILGIHATGFGVAEGVVWNTIPLYAPRGPSYLALNVSLPDMPPARADGTQAAALTRSLVGTTDPFSTLDTVNFSWWQTLTAQTDRADTPQTIGPHAYLRGHRTYELVLSDPVYEEVQGRPLRVTVRFQPVAYTPLLRPLLAGRWFTRSAVAVAGQSSSARAAGAPAE